MLTFFVLRIDLARMEISVGDGLSVDIVFVFFSHVRIRVRKKKFSRMQQHLFFQNLGDHIHFYDGNRVHQTRSHFNHQKPQDAYTHTGADIWVSSATANSHQTASLIPTSFHMKTPPNLRRVTSFQCFLHQMAYIPVDTEHKDNWVKATDTQGRNQEKSLALTTCASWTYHAEGISACALRQLVFSHGDTMWTVSSGFQIERCVSHPLCSNSQLQ